MFSPSGEKLRSFGKYGFGEGDLNAPQGVAVDGEGNILVADCKNNRIQKFTASGSFLKAAGTFLYPTNVAFNPANNKVYVTDMGNCRVQVLNSDLTTYSTFGKRGDSEGQFDYPCGIACDTAWNVYVADTENHCIQVFTTKGVFLRKFGWWGKKMGELDKPPCVAVDANNMVYVTEHNNYRVSVFNPEGRHVRSFGERGIGPGRFGLLWGVAVDDSGLVYVCDCVNNCVQVF